MKAKPEPVAGIDYPRTYQEFERWFADETSCRNYLFQLRWPQGFNCPRCGSKTSPWVTARGYLHCPRCEGEISVTAGTIFERTRSPLKTWFAAMGLVTSQKQGASTLGLQRMLGLGSYPDRLSVVAEIETGHGSTGTGTPPWARRGRRDIRRWQRKRQ